jgi:Electron transfer DM13
MKKGIFLIVASIFMLTACTKELETSNDPVTIDATAKVLASGSFVSSGNYSTTGEVKLIQKADQKKYLVITNLKSSAGPDLRLYLAEDNSAKAFSEVANKVVNGNSEIEIPTSVNTDKQKSVLIWCKQFSVLFGSAALK